MSKSYKIIRDYIKVKIPIFNVYLYIATNTKHMLKDLNVSSDSINNSNGSTFTYDNKSYVVVWYRTNKNNKVKYSTIAHESLHIAYHIINSIGSRVSDDTEEILAYLVGYLTDIQIKIFKENKIDTLKNIKSI